MATKVLIILQVTILLLPVNSSDYKFRLKSGKNYYGIAELMINGFFNDKYYPICPGRDFEQSAKQISSVICQELGFFDGQVMKIKSDTPDMYWYNTFDSPFSFNIKRVPKIGAYTLRNWTLVDGRGEFSYCPTSVLAVYCQGEVSLFRGKSDVPEESDLSFGAIISRAYNRDDDFNKEPGKPHYLVADDPTMKVICRELGFGNNLPTKISSKKYQTTYASHYKILQKKFKCAGDEKKIKDCPTEDFQYAEDVDTPLVQCSTAGEPDNTFRINSQNNMIEVMRMNTWGLVCGTERLGELICKEKGYSRYRYYMKDDLSVDFIREKIKMMWIYQAQCDQGADKTSDCRFQDFPGDIDEQCSLSFVKCYHNEAKYSMTAARAYPELGNHFIKRVNGGQNGIVAVGSNDEAKYLCQGLNYKYGKTYLISLPSSGSSAQNYWKGRYTSSSILCQYNSREKLIDDCYRDWKFITDAGLNSISNMTVCFNTVYLEGNGYSGIVRYMYNPPTEDIAYINVDSLGNNEVDLICKHLGYNNGGNIINLYSLSHHFDLYDIVCPGDSQNIDDCTFTKNPSATTPAEIECLLDTTNINPEQYFLDSEGIVHIAYSNTPVRVCANDKWTSNTTVLFCRKLGFTYSNSFTRKQEPFSNPIGYKFIHCNGTERDFKYCMRVPLPSGAAQCDTVMAVSCYNDDKVVQVSPFDYGKRYGRVWITKGGRGGYYCPDTFDENHAGTVCRSIGYISGTRIHMDVISNNSSSWWAVKDMNCGETTNHLEACNGRYWENVRRNSDKALDCLTKTAAVYCFKRVQFESGPYLNYGVIMNTITKQRFSNRTFGNTEANIACKEMGYPLGGRVFPNIYYTASKSTPLSVKCKGSESSLLDCPTTNDPVDKNFFAAVVCETGDPLPSEDSVKIADDSRVLVFNNGAWGTICGSYGWEKNTANTICLQLTGDGGSAIARSYSTLIPYAKYRFGWDCGEATDVLSHCSKDDSLGDSECDYSAAVYCYRRPTTVSALTYPEPVQGKNVRSYSSASKILVSSLLKLTITSLISIKLLV